MKIGILECDSVPDPLQVKYKSYSAMLMQSFDDIGCDFEYFIYDVTKHQFPDDINSCDAYITTGSRRSVNDDQTWIADLMTFANQCHKKLVGICFGHQLIAKALGAEVKRSDAGWGIGLIENQLCQHEVWMQPYQEHFNMIVCHEDQVINLPDGALLLASNHHCKHFVVQFNDNMLGIQGHPEFSNDFCRELMEVRADVIPAPNLESGQKSLHKSSDHAVIIEWIAQFIKQQ